jgi:hypothetical protein
MAAERGKMNTKNRKNDFQTEQIQLKLSLLTLQKP